MSKLTNRKKRNKLAVALLSPILIITFFVGWCLYFTGASRQSKARQSQKSIKNKTAEQDGVEFSVISPEDEQKILSK